MGPSRFAIALVVAVLAATNAARAAPDAEPSVHETVTSGLYEIEARFVVQAPAAIAWSVLTDYEAMPRFLASVKRSTIAERDRERPRRIVLEQRLLAHVLLVTRTLRLRLQVDEAPPLRIDFRDLSLGDFASYAGSWTLGPGAAPDEIEVIYRLAARPRRATPSFVVGPALRDGAAALIAQIRAEIARRAARPAGEETTAKEESHEPTK